MPDPIKSCVYCGESMKQSAAVCKHCDRFQSTWGNWSAYLPHAIAILPFIVAAVAYSAQQGSKFYASSFGKTRLTPLYYSSADYSSYFNDGDKDALVQTMNFRSDELRHASLVNVYRLVKVGETHVYHPTLPPAEIVYQPCSYVGGSVPVYGLTVEQKTAILADIRNGKTLRQLDLDIEYFASNHQQLNFHSVNNSSGELVTFPAKMSLTYCHIRGHENKTTTSDCVAILMATEESQGNHPYLQRIGRENPVRDPSRGGVSPVYSIPEPIDP